MGAIEGLYDHLSDWENLHFVDKEDSHMCFEDYEKISSTSIWIC